MRILIMIFIGCLVSLAWAGEPVVTLMYFERPPYMTLDPDGRLAGLVGEPVEKAVTLAGLRVVREEAPAARQLYLMQRSTRPLCGIGWFRTPEREQWARFSLPLYTDHPYQLVSRFSPPYTLAELLANGGTLLVQHGYAYGEPVDSLIRRHEPQVTDVTVPVTTIMNMLRHGRADMALMAFEEVQALLSPLPEGWIAASPEDMPPGLDRHLMCNQAVGDDWIRRFNAGLIED